MAERGSPTVLDRSSSGVDRALDAEPLWATAGRWRGGFC